MLRRAMRYTLPTLTLSFVLGSFACAGRADLETENAELKQRVAGLESENEKLRRQVEQLTNSVPRMEALTAERRGLEEKLQWLEQRLDRDAGARPDGG